MEFSVVTGWLTCEIRDLETPSPGWENRGGQECPLLVAVAEDSLLQFPPLGAGPTGPLGTGVHQGL